MIGPGEIPLFNWAPRSGILPWLQLLEAAHHEDMSLLPAPPEAEAGLWPPSGMEWLGEALQWAASAVLRNAPSAAARDASGAIMDDESVSSLWRYYYGVWLAGHGRIDEAIEQLVTVRTDWRCALLGRLLREHKRDYAASRDAYRMIESAAWSLHPQVVVERDVTLAHFGLETLEERQQWLDAVGALQDDALVERKICLLIDRGSVSEAKALLVSTPFEKVHQRYKRTQLWNRIAELLGEEAGQVPETLGEDDLATYGAYRVSQHGGDV